MWRVREVVDLTAEDLKMCKKDTSSEISPGVERRYMQNSKLTSWVLVAVYKDKSSAFLLPHYILS